MLCVSVPTFYCIVRCIAVLENLAPKKEPGTRLPFPVQGGFPEMSQSRCCEHFLKTLPDKLGCEYGGAFIRGNMFGTGFLRKRLGVKMVQHLVDIGHLFARYGYFSKKLGCKDRLDANPMSEFLKSERLDCV